MRRVVGMSHTAVLHRAAPAPADTAGNAASHSAEPDDFPGIGRRREPARLLVVVDGSASSTHQLTWALQEAGRREAVVLAVAVVDADADEATRTVTRTLMEAEVRHAVGRTGVHGRASTALLEPPVYEALTAATAGGDLVVIRPHRKTVLRPAVPRPPVRRPLTRCG